MPADLIYDETAALIGDDQSKAVVIVCSFQPISASESPWTHDQEIGLA